MDTNNKEINFKSIKLDKNKKGRNFISIKHNTN